MKYEDIWKRNEQLQRIFDDYQDMIVSTGISRTELKKIVYGE